MDISAQIAWERECQTRGSDLYHARQDKLADKGRLDQQEGYQFAMRSRITDIAHRLDSLQSHRAGVNNKYIKWVNYISGLVSSEVIAFFATQVLLRSLASGKDDRNRHITVTKVGSSIGERMETEIKCILFEKENPAYYDLLMKSMKERGTVDYVHKRKVMLGKFKDYAIAWNDWDSATRVGVGCKVLEQVLDVMQDIVFVNKLRVSMTKTISKIDTTVYFDDWLAEFAKERGLLQPALLPLKIKPLDWDETGVGGYYSPRMQSAFPFIKTKGKEHQAFVDLYVPQQHIAAVNKLQGTAWCINTRILGVVEAVYSNNLGFGLPTSIPVKIPKIPEYLKVDKEHYDEEMHEDLKFWKSQAREAYLAETKRKGKVLSFMQTVKLARELKDWEELYFAYSCDFRGRVYCATACLSPQSNELARALLLFKEATEVGEAGIFWLKQHGADKFGVKGTFQEKVDWIDAAQPYIAQIVSDPLTFTAWAQADKPYSFLAFCFEWACIGFGSDPTAKSSLVVGIDGSCNGLQHMSAVLRDREGARATNLTKTDRPQDVYGLVANRTTTKVTADNDGWSQLWLHVGFTRVTVKRQTMTLPYGATKQSCKDYTFAWVSDNWEEFDIDKTYRWKVASYAADFIWDSIGEVVPSAIATMAWLHKNIRKHYHRWVSHVGFPVYQYYKSTKDIRVKTQLAGGTRLVVHDIDNPGEPNVYRQRLGVVPNFVHSMDASHMVMTINNTELSAYSMIHDEFGTHASHVTEMYHVTREQFHALHSVDQLARWAEHQGISAEYLPEKGDYDIDEVLEADYLFG